MNYQVIMLLSYSVLIGAVLAVFRFAKIKRMYYPFIFILWLATINEILSHIIIEAGYPNTINSNIYTFLESILILWFFNNLGTFKNHFIPLVTGFLFTIVWVLDSFVINSISADFCSWFILFYSFPVVLFSINSINRMLIREVDLLKKPEFLICIGFIIFFTYRIIVEVFWMYGLVTSNIFANRVYHILAIINFLCNLIYALAILWMKKKQVYTLQF